MEVLDRSYVGFENLLNYLKGENLDRIEGKCVHFDLPSDYEIDPKVLGEFANIDGNREFYFFEREGNLFVNIGLENCVSVVPLKEDFHSRLHLHTHPDSTYPSLEDVEMIEQIGHGPNFGVLSSERIVKFYSPSGYNSDDIYGGFDLFLRDRKISHYSLFGLITGKKNWSSLKKVEKQDLVRDFVVELGAICEDYSLDSIESKSILDKFFKFSP